jgi:NAD(P)-dependent dehydrogenase (short-subunit alcohol dehydrogenase family)
MAEDQTTPQDPVERFPSPEMPSQTLEHPGLESDMELAPDYGAESYRGSARLEGRKAIITGGDSGIGRAVALAFAREGADVLLSYLPEEESDAQATAAHVRDAGRTAVTVPGDVQDPAYCATLVERALAEFGQLDVLVCNAAYQLSREGIESITPEELDRTFRTNILSMFHLCRAALPRMRAGGSIITTSSVEAYQPKPHLLDYAATKGAIVNFTKGLALEAIERGIRVNSVAPGPVWTPLIPATMPPDRVEGFGSQSPIGRAAQPVELAPAYVFLASAESSYVNAEILGVTGGTPLP